MKRALAVLLTLALGTLLGVACSDEAAAPGNFDPDASFFDTDTGPGSPPPSSCLYQDCAGTCVDFQSDRSNCGGCNKRCTGALPNCSLGQCVATCPTNETNCNGSCVDLQSNGLSCGTCGNSCNGGTCVNGACSCPLNKTACGTTCADLSSDRKNCGTCNAACSGGRDCVSSQCVCAAGASDCGANGCVVTISDPNRCGSCTGQQCANTQECVSGQCQCRPGLQLCNGTCVNLLDPAHCGSCTTQCTGGQLCTSSGCQTLANCPAGTSQCGTSCVDLKKDPLNCGQCGKKCDRDQLCVYDATANKAECRNYDPAPGCTSCPCNTCGGNACCLQPGSGSVLCVEKACPLP